MTILDLQKALQAAGFDPGPIDGIAGAKTHAAVIAFQRARGLVADGIAGPITRAALGSSSAPAAPKQVAPKPAGYGAIIPAAWMPAANMARIIVHWTAGTYQPSGLDRTHYHVLIDGDGQPVRGLRPISANAAGSAGPRASHTLNCNTGSIGIAVCCMGGAVERPFDGGRWPLLRVQWEALCRAVADLARGYSIPIGPRTVLSHAEVQANLGIAQRGKWDIARLAFDPSVTGARAIGDLLRATVSNHLATRS